MFDQVWLGISNITKLVFQAYHEGFKVAVQNRQNKYMGASVFADWWAYKFGVYYSICPLFNADILMQMVQSLLSNSILLSLNSHLYHEAA